MSNILYVQHSGQTLDLSALEDLFSTVGDVDRKSLEINPLSPNATMRGVFEMSSVQQALDCATRFHGRVINGHSLSVVSAKSGMSPKL